MSARARGGKIRFMARYLLRHRHQPPRVRRRLRLVQRTPEPLRRQAALASCPCGGHEIGWAVQASTGADPARLLPFSVAQRTTVTHVGEVEIP